MKRRCRWRERLRQEGFRLTTAREAIIDLLKDSEEHLSAEDIYYRLHKRHPEIGLTTVYRTLDLLSKMGIMAKFDAGEGRARYELSESYGNKQHHHHLICTSCHKIIDYSEFLDDELQFLHKAESGLSDKYGFKITGHTIQFKGTCPECLQAAR